MAIPKIIKKELAFVILGSFNPAIISPAWLGSNGLLRESEVSDPDIKIINNDLSIFKTGWLDVAVDHKRLQFKTSLESVFDSLKDLTISTLSVLVHSSVTQLGINHRFVFQLKNKKERDELGFKLVPKQNWSRFCNYDGMASLEIDAHRTDEFEGKVKIHISPDISSLSAFKLTINDHYELKSSLKKQSAEYLMDILSENWKNSFNQSKTIIKGLFE